MTIPTEHPSPANSAHGTKDRPESALPGLLLGGGLTVCAFAALAVALSAVPTSQDARPDLGTVAASARPSEVEYGRITTPTASQMPAEAVTVCRSRPCRFLEFPYLFDSFQFPPRRVAD